MIDKCMIKAKKEKKKMKHPKEHDKMPITHTYM